MCCYIDGQKKTMSVVSITGLYFFLTQFRYRLDVPVLCQITFCIVLNLNPPPPPPHYWKLDAFFKELPQKNNTLIKRVRVCSYQCWSDLWVSLVFYKFKVLNKHSRIIMVIVETFIVWIELFTVPLSIRHREKYTKNKWTFILGPSKCIFPDILFWQAKQPI